MSAPAVPTWEEALKLWAEARVREHLVLAWEVEMRPSKRAKMPTPSQVPSVDIKITRVEENPASEVQIGDMTWDYDDPSFTIVWTQDGRPNMIQVDRDFDAIVREIVAAARAEEAS